MTALALAALFARLNFTLPAFDASPDGCSPGEARCVDLARLYVTTLTCGAAPRTWSISVAGWSGNVSIYLTPDSTASVYVRVSDRAGNLSCPSNRVVPWPPTAP